MVAIRNTHSKEEFNLTAWLINLPLKSKEITELTSVFAYCNEKIEAPEKDKSRLVSRAVEIIGILLTLHMDIDSLKVAILYPFIEEKFCSIEVAEKEFGDKIAKLIRGVKDMEAIRFLHNLSLANNKISDTQIDTVRRMLLAMVEDVRAVVIKLSERIATLREVKNASEEKRILVAQEISNIYAPLANRLGIGQLKWELEDLSFRYLHPDTYKKIAKLLDEKRVDRENYINKFVQNLSEKIKAEGIEAEVYGRPKHIYSIWRKMQKKNLDFTDLYDVRAVRVIVNRLQDCYAVLGVIHTMYHHIPREFDDYIANPKPNGYQSIHTVVIGPEGKTVEIQMRTSKMHQEAELGVAAHWKYKEGKNANLDAAYEERIAWLRKLLAWQEDMVETGAIVEEFKTQVFEERVYVFTPKGDVVDLPIGATPLDFAYHIHSMVGHCCIGAKVDGRIVPFSYQLQTGDQVELTTQKEPNPKRDWLNPANGFLHSSKARAKVSAWFKKIDKDKNEVSGRLLLEKELERLGIILKKEQLPTLIKGVLQRFNAQDHKDIFVGIGAGDIRLNQIVHYIQEKLALENDEARREGEIIKGIEQRTQNRIALNRKVSQKSQVVVNEVGNIVTTIAKCCHPIPGEPIVGFITQGRGVSIHRCDCEAVKNLSKICPERIVTAEWGGTVHNAFNVTVSVVASDRPGLLRDVTTVIASDKINVSAVRSTTNTQDQTYQIDLDLEVKHIDDLNKTLVKISQINDIISVKRL